MVSLHGLKPMSRKLFIFTSLFLFTFTVELFAVPARPGVITQVQPDGSEISLRLIGDEFISWFIDQDGYTVTQNKKTGYFVYAVRGEDGKLEATTSIVGQADPAAAGLVKGITPDTSKAQEQHLEFQEEMKTRSPYHPEVGEAAQIKNLVLLIAFNDHYDSSSETVLSAYGRPREEYDALFNHNTISSGVDEYNAAPGGSVRDYWRYNSYGKVVMDSTVVDWIKLPYDASYYADDDDVEGTAMMIYQALNRLQTRINNNPDGPDAIDLSKFDTLTAVHSGYGAENGLASGIWSHAYRLSTSSYNWTWSSDDGSAYISTYCTIPALSGVSGNQLIDIGVAVHELGHHALGLPDLYDTDAFESAFDDYTAYNYGGVGDWCVMAGGSWGFNGNPDYPVHLCAPLKYQLSFIEPVVLNREEGTNSTDSEGRRAHNSLDTQIIPDPSTETGWGAYTINAGCVDEDAFYLVDLSTYEFTYNSDVQDAKDMDVFGEIFLHTYLYSNTNNRWRVRWNNADRDVIPRDSIAFIGSESGSGIFRGGIAAGLPFDAGIVLSTGTLEAIKGPNSSSTYTSNNGEGGNTLLGGLGELIVPYVLTEVDDTKLTYDFIENYDASTTNAAGFTYDLVGQKQQLVFDFAVATDESGYTDSTGYHDNFKDLIAIIVDDTVGWIISPNEDIDRNVLQTSLIKIHLDPDPNNFMADLDKDGIADDYDPDVDGDKILDKEMMDPDDPTVVFNEDTLFANNILDEGEDRNGDGYLSIVGGDPDISTFYDMDGDLIHDNYDLDVDGDLVLDKEIMDPNDPAIVLEEDRLIDNDLLDPGEDENGDGFLSITGGDPEIKFLDMDFDGIHDVLDKDVDGDLILDGVILEDVDGDGVGDRPLCPGEDTNHNWRIDISEDLDGDHRLDSDEDLNGNGVLDQGEDLDDDGNLDVDEDYNGNGRLDNTLGYNTDGTPILIYDRDGNPVPTEDLDGDGLLYVNAYGWDELSDCSNFDLADVDLSLVYADDPNLYPGYGDPGIMFVDEDEDQVNDHVDMFILAGPRSSYRVTTELIEVMNTSRDNRRANSHSVNFTDNGKPAYNTEFNVITDEIHVELDMNDLAPLFNDMPDGEGEPAEDGSSYLWVLDERYQDDLLDYLGLTGYVMIGTYTDGSEMEEENSDFISFMEKDYHNIKIIVADKTNSSKLDRGETEGDSDTALFLKYGSFSYLAGYDNNGNPVYFNSEDSYNPNSEYLLVENRQRVSPFGSLAGLDPTRYPGFEYDMPATGGLAIWHVDESVPWSNDVSSYPGDLNNPGYPSNGYHNEIAIVQPDNLYEVEKGTDYADAGDLYAAPAYTDLNFFTSPSTDSYMGGIVSRTYANFSHITESAKTMGFVFMETGVYNDNIARAISVNDYAEFGIYQDPNVPLVTNWWLGDAEYGDDWWKYIAPDLEGIDAFTQPEIPFNHPRLTANYIPDSYRIYGDTTYAQIAWIPDPFDPLKWEHGAPCASYDRVGMPYDAKGDTTRPTDSKALWYTMTAEKSGFVKMNTCSSEIDTTLTVYEDPQNVYDNNKNYNDDNYLACNDDSESSDPECYYSSEVVVYMEEGEDYLIRVGGYNYESGKFSLNINYLSPKTYDAPEGARELHLDSPRSGDMEDSSDFDLWYTFMPEETKEYRFTVCTEEFDSMLTIYKDAWDGELVAENDDYEYLTDEFEGGCTVDSSVLSVELEAGVKYFVRVAVAPSRTPIWKYSNGDYRILVTTGPENDYCSNAIFVKDYDVYGDEAVYTGSLVDAHPSYWDGEMLRSSCNSMNADHTIYDVWYVYSPLVTGDVFISLQGSKFDTVVSVYDSCGGSELECGDNVPYCPDCDFYYEYSEVTCNMIAGKRYYIRISGWGSDVGDYRMTVQGGQGNASHGLDIIAGDLKYFVDAEPASGKMSGQVVDMYIEPRGGTVDPETGLIDVDSWTVNPAIGFITTIDHSSASNFVEPDLNAGYVELNFSDENDSMCKYEFTTNFIFQFYDIDYTTMYVSTNGFIRFGSEGRSLPANSMQGLRENVMVAPLWDDYKYDSEGFGVFVKETIDSIVVTWIGEYIGVGGSYEGDICEFSATLKSDGTITFNYGDIKDYQGNVLDITPTVGVSAGTQALEGYLFYHDYTYQDESAEPARITGMVTDQQSGEVTSLNALKFSATTAPEAALPDGLKWDVVKEPGANNEFADKLGMLHIYSDPDYINGDGQNNEGIDGDYSDIPSPQFKIEVTVTDYSVPPVTVSHTMSISMVDGFDIEDLANLIDHWREVDCGADNWCDQADLNGDTVVNIKDFAVLADFWLIKTGGNPAP